MSTNRNDYFDESDLDEDRLIDDLGGNTGRIITVFTKSGGCSGRGFTGLLVKVDCRFIKLITELPSAPRHPFGRRFDRDDFGFGFDGGRCCERSRFGTAIVIPIRDIVAFVFNEV
jgi:hypothetical protein